MTSHTILLAMIWILWGALAAAYIGINNIDRRLRRLEQKAKKGETE